MATSEPYPYARDPNGSAEVAGEAAGVTLLECIQDGRVPDPGALNYQQWLRWRKVAGRRPTVRRDGRGLNNTQELALYRAVMVALRGEEEVERLESTPDDGDEDEPLDPRGQGGGPALEPVPPALTDGRMDGATSGQSTSPVQPPPGGLPTSDANSDDRSSEASQGSLMTVAGMLALLDRAAHDPAKEPLSEFLSRIDRYEIGLSMSGVDVPPLEVKVAKTKGMLINQLYRDSGGDLPAGVATRVLTEMFIANAQSGAVGEDSDVAAIAIQRLVTEFGAKESRTQGKLFSTPSEAEKSIFPSSPDSRRARSPPAPVTPPPKFPRLFEMPGGSPQKEPPPSAHQGVSQEEFSKLRDELNSIKLAQMAQDIPSEAGLSGKPEDPGLAEAIRLQTEAIMKLAEKSTTTKRSSITSVRAEVKWPTLTDSQSDAKDVREFYDEFENVCSYANDCGGMNYKEMLLALRPRCQGARLKTFENIMKREHRRGTTESDPKSVYLAIKSKHLMFAESAAEKEIRVDAEWAALTKGKDSANQFEPKFEAAIMALEEVGLAKNPRELYLSYMRKIGTQLASVVRADRRLWDGSQLLREPETWEEAHKVCLEYEARANLNKVAAGADMNIRDGALTTSAGVPKSDGSGKQGGAGTTAAASLEKQIAKLSQSLAQQSAQLAAFKGSVGPGRGKVVTLGERVSKMVAILRVAPAVASATRRGTTVNAATRRIVHMIMTLKG